MCDKEWAEVWRAQCPVCRAPVTVRVTWFRTGPPHFSRVKRFVFSISQSPRCDHFADAEVEKASGKVFARFWDGRKALVCPCERGGETGG